MPMITLQHNRPVRIAAATRLECVGGIVWLTRTGGAGDVFLRAGESCHLAATGWSLVEAIGVAQVRVVPAPSLRRRFLERAANVLSSAHERMRIVRFSRRRTSVAG